MKCKKCGSPMKTGKAFQNEVSMGVPDFPGNTIHSRGQTVSRNGKAVLIEVFKCVKCGRSVEMRTAKITTI